MPGKIDTGSGDVLQQVAEAEQEAESADPTPGRIVLLNIGVVEPVLRPAIVVDSLLDEGAGKIEVHPFLTAGDFPLPAAIRLNDGGRGSTTVVVEAAEDDDPVCGEWMWPPRTSAASG